MKIQTLEQEPKNTNSIIYQKKKTSKMGLKRCGES